MKIKGLLMGMAAFMGFALFSCSDDAIENGNELSSEDSTSAFLTVSFSPMDGSSARSTADDVNNMGDKDGDAEHSGHTNVGTAAENAVNSALIVVKATNAGKGYAKLYSYLDKDALGYATNKDVITPSSVTGSFVTNKPIELNTGIYDVLVVVNPYQSLYSGINNIGNGTSEEADVSALYNSILDGKYTVGATTIDNYAGDIVQVDNNTLKGITMANKSASQVEVRAANLAGNPAKAHVSVERVASKITFRHTTPENGSKDVYPVKISLPSSIVPITYTIYEYGTTPGGQPMTGGEILNEAFYDGKTIYVVLTPYGAPNYYYEEESVEIENKKAKIIGNSIAINNNENFDASKIEYKYNEEKAQTETWYVKLEKYALVNLSKSVYNIRHTIEGNGKVATSGAKAVHFGVLDGDNFLYTPNWPAINAGTDFADFFNPLSAVSDASKVKEPTSYFTTFASILTGSDDSQEVTGKGDKQHTDNLSPIGDLLAYCLENSTDVDHQTHGLSTGITFMAKMYKDKNCTTPIANLYRYAGHLFQSVSDIQKAYNIKYTEGAEGLAGLNPNATYSSVDKEHEALNRVGIVKYAGNTCYYYTTEIKHFDNGDPAKLGNMEFAIMRNNIYSLAVTHINIIGDPYVEPTPDIPNEILDTYLTVEAKIQPWTVRYHDIEF